MTERRREMLAKYREALSRDPLYRLSPRISVIHHDGAFFHVGDVA